LFRDSIKQKRYQNQRLAQIPFCFNSYRSSNRFQNI